MRVSPVTEQFAVRIEDVDLSKPLSPGDREQVLDCWMRYKVAVFPGQDLDDEALAEFAAQFGSLFVHVQKQLLRPKGRKSLYLSPMHIRTVGQKSEEESARLMSALIAHATQPAHVYTHRWSVGDVVMWDNTSVMHRRNAFPEHQQRHLIRAGFHLPDDRAVPG